MPFKFPKVLDKQSSAYLLSKVDNFMFDCDGVIWNFPHALPGSVECINKLKELGIYLDYFIVLRSCSISIIGFI